jgi:molecular chaperone DnaJ
MAVIKDYYKILDVKSSASADEIKNAYRVLAMKYHPDRNPDDAIAAAVFSEMAEAYKVLSNTEARRQYNYDRHLTAAEEYQKPIETIESLILRINKINKQIKATDPFRLNKDALLYTVMQLLPGDISLLLRTNNDMLKQFLEMIVEAANCLSSNQTKQLLLLLQPLYIKQEWLQQKLNVLLQQQQKNERWEKYKVFLAIILTVILCVIIFFAAGK